MKVFMLLKLMPLVWQGHAQDEDFLIQMGKKNVIGLAPAAMFERSDAGWYCSENEINTLQAFVVNSDSTADAEIARNQCEDFCLTSAICWGCSVHATGTYQWNAITSCGTRTPWTGKIVGDITMKKAPTAGAYGDPHCVNAKGDWFDIHAVGKIPMVILPLGASIEDSDFAVIATSTTPDGWDKCAPTFISAVDVWANQAHDQLRVDAGPAGDLQVKPMNGTTEAYSIKMLSEKVMITFQSVIVSVILNKVPKIDQAPFLYFDMEVAGLQAVKAGGILGADPHDFAQVQPDGCSEVPFKHRAVDRYSMARAMP